MWAQFPYYSLWRIREGGRQWTCMALPPPFCWCMCICFITSISSIVPKFQTRTNFVFIAVQAVRFSLLVVLEKSSWAPLLTNSGSVPDSCHNLKLTATAIGYTYICHRLWHSQWSDYSLHAMVTSFLNDRPIASVLTLICDSSMYVDIFDEAQQLVYAWMTKNLLSRFLRSQEGVTYLAAIVKRGTKHRSIERWVYIPQAP